MNTNITQPETVGGQARAFEALADMARTFPDLPSIYTTVYQHGSSVSLQADTGADFEAWRTALGVPSADVYLTRYGKGPKGWIGFRSEWAGVALDLTTHDVVLPVEPQPEDEPVSLPREWSAQVSA